MSTPLLNSAQVLALTQTFRPAYGRLKLHVVEDWLKTQPRHRVIAMPREAVGGLLAVYLMHRTTEVWCIGESVFWPLQLGRSYARPLPTWAAYYTSLEDRYVGPLTVGDALTLVERTQIHMIGVKEWGDAEVLGEEGEDDDDDR
jgi:hypothetical protein